MAGSRVPELDASVLGAGKHPVSVRGESDGENKILVYVSRAYEESKISLTL